MSQSKKTCVRSIVVVKGKKKGTEPMPCDIFVR
jgi:hypothetical protein